MNESLKLREDKDTMNMFYGISRKILSEVKS